MGQRAAGLLQLFGQAANPCNFTGLLDLLEFFQQIFDRGTVVGRHLFAELAQCLFGQIDQIVGRIAGFCQFALPFVFFFVLLRLTHQPLYLVVGQIGGGGDLHALLFAGCFVFGSDMQNAIGVDVECDFDLRHPAWGRRDAVETEVAQGFVAAGHGPFPLQNMDVNCRLAVRGCAENFRLFGRDRRVARDEHSHHAAQGFQAQAQRRHIQQQQVADFTAEHAGLDGSADCDNFVRVDPLVRLFAGQLADQILHHRHAGGSSHHHDLIQLLGRETSILEGIEKGLLAALQEVCGELLKFAAAERHDQMLGAAAVRCDKRQVDLRLRHRGELNLGLFSGFAQTLQRLAVSTQIDTLFLLELFDQPVNDAFIPIVAAEQGVAIGRFDFDDAVADLQHRHIKRATAQVKDQNGLVIFLVQPIGHRRRGRFVDNAQHLEAGDLTRILGRLALAVVEIGRHRNDRLLHLFPKIVFCISFELGQHHRADFLRGIDLTFDRNVDPSIAVWPLCNPIRDHPARFLGLCVVEAAPHQALDRVDGVFWVDNCLAFGRDPYQTLPAFVESHHRRCRPVAFCIGDHRRRSTFHHRHDTVGGAQIDSNNFSHTIFLLAANVRFCR